MSKVWEGWFMENGKRSVRIIADPPLRSLADVQHWMSTHPRITGLHHIEWEEVEDKAPVSTTVPGGRGT